MIWNESINMSGTKVGRHSLTVSLMCRMELKICAIMCHVGLWISNDKAKNIEVFSLTDDAGVLANYSV